MSKGIVKGKYLKKTSSDVLHSTPLRVIIPAGMASNKPPLGSQLSQRKINVTNFCNEFNTRTADIKEGLPLPCRVKINPDGSFNLQIHNPPATYFLKQAAGIEKGKIIKGETAGQITFKHLYEIACIKAQDPPLALLSLKDVCNMLIGIARTCGIKVVRTLDPTDFEEFRKQREQNVQAFIEERELAKDAKVQRTA